MCSHVPVIQLKPGAGVNANVGLCSREHETERNGVRAARAISTKTKPERTEKIATFRHFAWIGNFCRREKDKRTNKKFYRNKQNK